MGLLSHRKKTEQLRTLTEKEIQEKLYGQFRLQTKDPSILSSVPSKNSAQMTAIEDREDSPVDLFFPPGLPSKLGVPKKSSKEELEEPAKEIKKTFLEPPFDTALPSKQRTFVKPPGPLASSPRRPNRAQVFLKFLQNATAVSVKEAGSFLIWFIKLAVAGFQSFIAFLSKGQNRYWFGGFIFITVLLGSIHYLNVQREIAMKTTRPRQAIPSLQARTVSAEPFHSTQTSISSTSPLSTVETGESRSGVVSSAPSLGGESEGMFVIQIVTYANPADATNLAVRLKHEGFPALVKQFTRSTGKVYHTVFVGRFKSYRDAQEILVRFQKKEMAKPFQDAFIRTLN